MLVERGEKNLTGVQILANVEDGKIVENQNLDERLDIASKIQLTGEDYFLLRVLDDTLRQEHSVCCDDYLLIRRARNAAENETVVVRGPEDRCFFAHCHFNAVSNRTELHSLGSDPYQFENACSGIYGVLVAMIRMKF